MDLPLVLNLGVPPAPIWSLNEERTKHWSWRHQRVALWRDATFWMAKETKLAGDMRDHPAWTITVHIPVSDGRRRDPHNYTGTVVKSCVDGLVLAGCVEDDDPAYVSVAEPILYRGTEVRVVLEPRP